MKRNDSGGKEIEGGTSGIDRWLDRPRAWHGMEWNGMLGIGRREDKLLNHRKWRTGPADLIHLSPLPEPGALA